MLNSIVHPVVNVEGGKIRVAHPGTVHIGFVSHDQSRGHTVYGMPVLLLVVGDSGNNSGNFIRMHPHLHQDRVSHHRPRNTMLITADNVAYVMHIPRYGGQFGLPLGIP
jgi:hypothetical protein